MNKNKKEKKKRTDLFVRELTESDAHSYSQISAGDDLHRYVCFLEASGLDEAEERIRRCTTQYEKLYGLFTKANSLVAIFDVSDDIDHGATVHYFVGERHYGNNYAVHGIQHLVKYLYDHYSHFHFEVSEDNIYSLNVQAKLGSIECKPVGNYRNFVYSF